MKKNYTLFLGVCLGVVLSLFSYQSIIGKSVKVASVGVLEVLDPNAEAIDENLDMVKAGTKKRVILDTAPKNSGKTVASRGTTTKARVTTSTKYGELLDWWTQAQKIFSTGSVATVTDLKTGRTFKVKRTMGAYHADCEAYTKADADIIKSIWCGFSWDRRAVIVSVKGRRIAASMTSLPHAGVDSAPAFAVVDNRSEGYGRGENLDVIKGNGMNGHFDIHFLNSKRHKDNRVDLEHQKLVHIAAGK